MDEVQCCGFAGDKGFSRPELNEHALRHLKPALPAQLPTGYSTSRTCEIGLSEYARHSPTSRSSSGRCVRESAVRRQG